ncbi:MAG: hypothetical protein AB7F98_00900 [Novosphingobium sp.]
MKNGNIAIVVACGAAIASIPLIAQQRAASGPVARYDMRAGTVTGIGGMGRMNPMAMAMGGGRGNSVQHELLLRLGSSNTPAGGGPKADHFMPPNAKLGKSVALVTPREERIPDEMPERPKGRLLIFWGCGEHAPAGQPVIIDFAKLAAGQIPPGLWSTTIIRDWGPTPQNSRTFGRWPAEDGKYVKPDSSLPGPHRVAGNYSPEIAFTLAKDFMQPLSVRHTSQASGSTLLNWAGIADATGYLATVFGGKQGPRGDMGDMVMWSSSATRQFGGGLSDWLTPAQVAGLVRDRTLLPPTATACTVPVEVQRAAPDFRMGTLTAFGPMEEFSYPPRPANPRAAWNLEWTARIRHKSTTSWMDMAGMEGMQGMEDESEQPAQPRCKPRRGLGGLLGGALGGGNGC